MDESQKKECITLYPFVAVFFSNLSRLKRFKIYNKLKIIFEIFSILGVAEYGQAQNIKITYQNAIPDSCRETISSHYKIFSLR